MEERLSGYAPILTGNLYPNVLMVEAVRNQLPPAEAADSQTETTDPTAEVWEVHSLRIGVIRFVGPCEYTRENCTRPAGIRIEVRKRCGAPEWDGDYCHEHADRLVAKARAAGVTVIDD